MTKDEEIAAQVAARMEGRIAEGKDDRGRVLITLYETELGTFEGRAAVAGIWTNSSIHGLMNIPNRSERFISPDDCIIYKLKFLS